MVESLEPIEPAEWATPSYFEEPAAQAAPRRHSKGLVALAAGLATVMVGGGVAFSALSAGTTNRPEDAVQGLLTAASNGDVLGVLDHLDPAETRALVGPLRDGTTELKRLGVLSGTTNLKHIGGVNATFKITTSAEKLRPDLVAITITGGSVHGHIEPSQLPLGPLLRDVAGSALAKEKPRDTTKPLESAHLPPLLTVERNTGSGRQWFVSIGYTIADNARRKANMAMPAASASVPARGAASATEAVDGFLRAAAAYDVRRVIELTPPQEMAALHDYAPLFLGKADAAIDRERHKLPVVTINDLKLAATIHGDTALVKVVTLDVSAASEKTHVSYRTGEHCLTVTGADAARSLLGVCGARGAFSANGSSADASDGSQDSTPGLGLAGLFSEKLGPLGGIHPQIGIVAEKAADGKWYVSPLRTALDNGVAVLHSLPADTLEKLRKTFSDGFNIGSSSDTGSSSGVPAPPVPGAGSWVHGSSGSPSIGACINGTRTVTFPPVGGRTIPPRTLVCNR